MSANGKMVIICITLGPVLFKMKCRNLKGNISMSVNHLKQQVQSLEEYNDALKKGKDGEMEMAETKESVWPKEKIRIRLLPIWLRLVLLIVFTCISLMAGAAVGYGVIGDGKAADVFKTSTWTHIIDLVNKDDRQKE